MTSESLTEPCSIMSQSWRVWSPATNNKLRWNTQKLQVNSTHEKFDCRPSNTYARDLEYHMNQVIDSIDKKINVHCNMHNAHSEVSWLHNWSVKIRKQFHIFFLPHCRLRNSIPSYLFAIYLDLFQHWLSLTFINLQCDVQLDQCVPQAFFHRFSLNSRRSKLKVFSKLKIFSLNSSKRHN